MLEYILQQQLLDCYKVILILSWVCCEGIKIMDASIFSSMACGADSLRTPFICLSAALDPVRDEKKNTSFSSRYFFLYVIL
jgi:hypothetical protein